MTKFLGKLYNVINSFYSLFSEQIVNVSPTDFDGDGCLDVLITTQSQNAGSQETATVIVYWGNLQTLGKRQITVCQFVLTLYLTLFLWSKIILLLIAWWDLIFVGLLLHECITLYGQIIHANDFCWKGFKKPYQYFFKCFNLKPSQTHAL